MDYIYLHVIMCDLSSFGVKLELFCEDNFVCRQTGHFYLVTCAVLNSSEQMFNITVLNMNEKYILNNVKLGK